MGDREGLAARVAALNLNPDAIERIVVHMSDRFKPIIPNQQEKINSLQIYAAITTNDGYIGPDEARRGLELYSEELREEYRQDPTKHPSIGLLEQISSNGWKVRTDVIRRNSAMPVPAHVVEAIRKIEEEHPTPFHIYDGSAIVDNARRLKATFGWAPNFKNYFAVKACSNPFILKLLKSEGFGADCSSDPELDLAAMAGIKGEDIMFTSNNTPAEEFREARRRGAIINLDDITHITLLQEAAGIPEVVCCRYNPGRQRQGNSIIGQPEEAKYGFTREQLFDGYKMLKEMGAKRFGLHTMIASNELNAQYFVDTAKMLFELVAQLSKTLDIKFEFVNLGGGIGVPYKPEQKPVDLAKVSDGIRDAYEGMILNQGMPPLAIFMENGRMVTGPYGYLVSRVRHVMKKHKDYVGLDACMANLMRPALYGAYHHITVLRKEYWPLDHIYDVVGGLCENNDKFAINRPLPLIHQGDLVAIHTAGAHGYAMGFNYNGKLRSSEFLLLGDGRIRMIRRAETKADYFATLPLDKLDNFKA